MNEQAYTYLQSAKIAVELQFKRGNVCLRVLPVLSPNLATSPEGTAWRELADCLTSILLWQNTETKKPEAIFPANPYFSALIFADTVVPRLCLHEAAEPVQSAKGDALPDTETEQYFALQSARVIRSA